MIHTECPECGVPLSRTSKHTSDCTIGELTRSNSGRYILVDRVPVDCPDLLFWGYWLEEHAEDIQIGQTMIGGLFSVSTVFLGLDFDMRRALTGTPTPGGPKALFETLVFRMVGGRRDSVQAAGRCGTWDEAEAQHKRFVAQFQKALTS